ncbi:nitrite reductase small subunit NirD [Marinobacteraceae bacterium S3BR75-40.1]
MGVWNMTVKQTENWQAVCSTTDLVADAGIAVWTEAGPVAVFYVPGVAPEIFAIGHYDPIGQANVLARGIVGDKQGELVVASPLYKQHFSLTTGQCLEEADVSVPAFPVKLDGEQVLLNLEAAQARRKAA